MSLILQGSTSGSITLQEPAVAGSTVLDLPATSGTILTTGSSGQVIPKAALPTGSVLQVVTGTTATLASSSTTTYVDSGLTATITPLYSTSKILVLVSQNGITKNPSTTGSGLKLQLVRGSTVLIKIQGYAGYTESNSYNWIGGVSSCYVDSPATTSATTYKTQFANETNASSVSINSDGSTSVITLLEIAA
jgi:hypothetical protein